MSANNVFRGIIRTRSQLKCFLKCAEPPRSSVYFSSDATSVSGKETFGELFKTSKFATILDPVGHMVEAEVLTVVDDNMYVDFGCKFHAVVPVPSTGGENTYAPGSKVTVRVLNLEMTDHFIGDHRDISLLEAEAELVE